MPALHWSLLCLALSAASLPDLTNDSPSSNSNTPSHFHLSFGSRSASSCTFVVLWETSAATNTHVCHFGLSSKNLSSTAQGSAISSACNSKFVHTVFLPNLDYHTQYFYSCGDASAGFGPVSRFATGPPPAERSPFVFALIGDMGIKQSNGVSASMIKHQASFDWVLHIGDLGYADDFALYMDSYEGVYDKFFSEIEPLSSALAYMGMPGNHETSCQEVDGDACPACQRNYTQYRERWRFPGPESGGVGNMWYSFDYGVIHFVNVNTETDFPGAPENPGQKLHGGPFGDQLAWLKRDLDRAQQNRKNVPWIIMSGHRPVWYSDTTQITAAVQKAFLPFIEQYNVDIFFCGHRHNYESYWPITSSGHAAQYNFSFPSSPVYLVNGAGGNVEGHLSNSAKADFLRYRDNSKYGWNRVSVLNVSTLLVEWITESDEVKDSFYLRKDKS